MKRKHIIKYIVLPVLLVAAAAAIYIYIEYNRTHKDTHKLKADYNLSVQSLLSEFMADENAANKKYWDKVIRVEGPVRDLLLDDRGFYSIILGDTGSVSSIQCSMDSSHNSEAAILQKGNIVAVKGICSGFNTDELLGSDVILIRSVVDKKY